MKPVMKGHSYLCAIEEHGEVLQISQREGRLE